MVIKWGEKQKDEQTAEKPLGFQSPMLPVSSHSIWTAIADLNLNTQIFNT